MEAPNIAKPGSQSQLFERAVQFPNYYDMVLTVGMFAGHKAAIALTEQGASCEKDIRNVLSWFPNTKALLGVGIAYGMDIETVNFCDVLVAKQIADLGDTPRIQEGGIYTRGDVVSIKTILKNVFCKDDTGWHFSCSKTSSLPLSLASWLVVHFSWMTLLSKQKSRNNSSFPRVVKWKGGSYITRS